MGIGYRIKEARENLGFTQTELGKLIGVTGSAITNYENETSHPKETVMYKLIEALKVDANYLFQDCVNLPKEINDVTLGEYNIIKQYRSLDDAGKNHISYELNREVKRVDELQKQSEYIKKLELLNNGNDSIDPYADIPDTLEELEEQQPERSLLDVEHHVG
ncbi:hypothetical protein IMSAGC011_02230 [Lachnospiraceae bacterium]|nr:hypothetical protein IMSAGC011_02230 [Lachnospiraceae bacterium]